VSGALLLPWLLSATLAGAPAVGPPSPAWLPDHFELRMSLPDPPLPRLTPADDPSQRLPSFPTRVGHDLRDLARSPFHLHAPELKALGLAVLGVGTAHIFDERIRQKAIHVDEEERAAADEVRPLGREVGIALVAAAWIGGRTFHDPSVTAVAEDSFESMLLASGIVTPLLKQLVGRDRPRTGNGSSSFTGGASFPSGEATQAFTLASVFARHYHHLWVDALAYGSASLVAWQRVESDSHWTSDVVAGAAIGTAMGRWVVGRNDARRWSVETGIEPERRAVGINAAYHLGEGHAEPRG
jgi:membrane-associated phospholipid phosphatase